MHSQESQSWASKSFLLLFKDHVTLWPLLFLLPENRAVIDRAVLASPTSLSHVPTLDVLGERPPAWEMGLRRCALELAYPASKASTVCIFSTPRSVRSRWELDTGHGGVCGNRHITNQAPHTQSHTSLLAHPWVLPLLHHQLGESASASRNPQSSDIALHQVHGRRTCLLELGQSGWVLVSMRITQGANKEPGLSK